MNLQEDNRPEKAPLRRRLLGSALSALVGWLTLNVILFGYLGFSQRFNSSRNDWQGVAIIAVASAAFVAATWLLALVPLYLFVPLRFGLWRWYVCTPCGVVAGVVIMVLYGHYDSPQADGGDYDLLAAIAGGSRKAAGLSEPA